MVGKLRSRASLSRRYVTFFVVILVLPVFLAGIVLDGIYFTSLQRAIVAQMQDVVDQLAGAIDTEVRQIEILSAALINDQAFLDAARAFTVARTSTESYLLRQEIDRHIANLLNYTNKIGTILLFFADREPYLYQNYRHSRPEPVFDRSIVEPAIRQPMVNYVMPRLKGLNPVDPDRPLLSIAVSPEREVSRDGLMAIMLSFRISLFDDIDRARGAASYGAIHLLDDGYPILSSDEAQGDDDSSAMIVSQAQVASTGWQLVRTVDSQRLLQPLRRIRWVTYAIFFLLSVAFVMYTWLFFHDLVAPLHAIVSRMEIVETGDYTVRTEPDGPREVARLGHAFNSMLDQIQHLTQQTQAKERERTMYELEALQYRIQPHFVANTLNSIRLMAEAEGSTHIAGMSASLMRVVTESFNKSGRYATLDEEIRSVDSYVHIMKVRFGALIDVAYQIAEGVDQARVLKMLLQPIVENAILHGIRPAGRPGRITVSASIATDRLVITVQDNGTGMDRPTVAGLLQGPAHSSHNSLTRIGIYNVHRRITLNHGQPYGLQIDSELDAGTRVTLTLPVLADADV